MKAEQPLKNPINAPRCAYISIWVIAIVWAILSVTDVVPTEFLPHNAMTDYNVSVISIVTAIGDTYLALRLPSFRVFRHRFREVKDEDAGQRLYARIALIRVAIIATAMWMNDFLYFATTYSASTQYCLLITMIAAVFCWPTQREGIKLTGEATAPRANETEEKPQE